MQNLQNPLALIARLLLAFIFVYDGWLALSDYAGTASYMESSGVSGRLLPLVILTELGGGLLVAFGLFARCAGFALAGFCLLAALLFHRNFADFGEKIHFMKDFAISGGFLLLTAFGPGGWSLDAWRKGRRSLT